MFFFRIPVVLNVSDSVLERFGRSEYLVPHFVLGRNFAQLFEGHVEGIFISVSGTEHNKSVICSIVFVFLDGGKGGLQALFPSSYMSGISGTGMPFFSTRRSLCPRFILQSNVIYCNLVEVTKIILIYNSIRKLWNVRFRASR